MPATIVQATSELTKDQVVAVKLVGTETVDAVVPANAIAIIINDGILTNSTNIDSIIKTLQGALRELVGNFR